MTAWTVQCGTAAYYGNTVTVEADTLNNALDICPVVTKWGSGIAAVSCRNDKERNNAPWAAPASSTLKAVAICGAIFWHCGGRRRGPGQSSRYCLRYTRTIAHPVSATPPSDTPNQICSRGWRLSRPETERCATIGKSERTFESK